MGRNDYDFLMLVVTQGVLRGKGSVTSLDQTDMPRKSSVKIQGVSYIHYKVKVTTLYKQMVLGREFTSRASKGTQNICPVFVTQSVIHHPELSETFLS